MKIEPLDSSQLDEVTEIEARDGDSHWSRAQFAKELESEMKRFFVVVVDDAPGVLAYGGYWKAGPEAQITNIVVKKEFRCRGIGKRLMEFILDCAGSEGCSSCTLEVRQGNQHAQSLYQSLGFGIKGTRAKLYENPVEDAVLMEKIL